MAEDLGKSGEFRKGAAGRRPGLLREFWEFLKHNKKWWLLPILVALGLVALLVILGGSGLAPLLYPFF